MQQVTQGEKKVTGLSRNAARIELTPQAAALVQAARRILKFPKYQLEPDISLKDKNAEPVPVSGDLQVCLNQQMAAVEALKRMRIIEDFACGWPIGPWKKYWSVQNLRIQCSIFLSKLRSTR